MSQLRSVPRRSPVCIWSHLTLSHWRLIRFSWTSEWLPNVNHRQWTTTSSFWVTVQMEKVKQLCPFFQIAAPEEKLTCCILIKAIYIQSAFLLLGSLRPLDRWPLSSLISNHFLFFSILKMKHLTDWYKQAYFQIISTSSSAKKFMQFPKQSSPPRVPAIAPYIKHTTHKCTTRH